MLSSLAFYFVVRPLVGFREGAKSGNFDRLVRLQQMLGSGGYVQGGYRGKLDKSARTKPRIKTMMQCVYIKKKYMYL